MKNTGFTFVELIVVILLIGIISVFVAPRFFADSDFKARGISDEIITAIRHAQRLAMARGEQYQFDLTSDAASHIYRVQRTATGVNVRHPDGSIFEKRFPLSIPIVTPGVIVFDEMGRPVPNNPYAISIGTGALFTITVEQETGYAHL